MSHDTPKVNAFLKQLENWQALEQVGTDDLLAMVLPLMEQTAELHAQSLVAPLNGVDALSVAMGHLWFHNSEARSPELQKERIQALQPNDHRAAIEVTGHYSETRSDTGIETQDRRLAGRNESESRFAYYPDYIAWEHTLQHHDPLTDVFVLGEIMASLACGLNFTVPEDLAHFVAQRDNLSRLNPRLHPVVVKVIRDMTELDRRQRPQDLAMLIETLRHYREQELTQETRPESDTPEAAPQRIQAHLRNKLFEISRRNRMLYFKESLSTANLTLGSVPHVLDYKTIRLEQLMLCNQPLMDALSDGKPVALSRWLRFEDYPYLANTLDKIRLQAGRDEKEYGFSQLRLVLAFFRWHNLKEAPTERINSPLILVPAQLQKRKGVKDSFTLSTDFSQAEINPVLRHHLNQLYGIQLPERIDASKADAIHALHRDLQRQIDASARGVALGLTERPRIQLIARKAKRKLDDFRRKQRITGRGISDYHGIAYSYQANKFDPLGVQIFMRQVLLAKAPARDIIAANNRSAVFSAMVADETEIERDFYAIDQGQNAGEYAWELDLCAVTLANFNYRKMTLVRDYTELLETQVGGENFNTLFSANAKPLLQTSPAVPLAEQFHLLPADPSQSAAVWTSRSGESYVIQGPPGTGKSQTITNLIADYLAQKKSVLFVCEKRVALDVVYHRLKQVGIEEMCALIHDSQSDKKAFIDDLESLYKRWLSLQDANDVQRQQLLADIDALLAELLSIADALQAPIGDSSVGLRALLQRWIADGAQRPDITTAQRAQLPGLAEFERQQPLLDALSDNLHSLGLPDTLAASPFWCLRGRIAQCTDPEAELTQFCQGVEQQRAAVQDYCAQLQALLGNQNLNWQQLLAAQATLKSLLPLILEDQVKLLDPDSLSALKLQKHLEQWQQLQAAHALAEAAAEGWQLSELDADALQQALTAARELEGRWWRWLSGRWRRAMALLNAFGPACTGRYSDALALAKTALDARAEWQQKQREIELQFGLEDLATVAPLLTHSWQPAKALDPLERQLYPACVAAAGQAEQLAKLARDNCLPKLDAELHDWLSHYGSLPPNALFDAVQVLANQGQQAFDIADLLLQLDQTDPAINATVRTLPLPAPAIKQCIVYETLRTSLRRNRKLNRFDGERMDTLFHQLDEKLASLRTANGDAVMAAVRARFHESVQRASGSMARTSASEKDWRRAYNRGRKLLEREFEKNRAYRSIRELFAAESGALLRELKPIWMMSPLSVSDVLPLNEALFDVVIFDEASQIPLEDAVPALYRAKQMIVVGDEMQLPPSQFFASQSSDEDEQPTNLHLYNLNADSFLNRASGALPNTVLSWHYRSRHESLIGFCNQAFYQGQLQTVPSTQSLLERPAILIDPRNSGDDVRGLVNDVDASVYQRPISFHKLENSPYGQQRNPGEAHYIAQLVRALLLDARRDTLGIVAFSQAQQQEIESALARLASKDKAFANALDAEEEREDEDQFVGLFVKNLENVQGDERDIIILSVCYGPNAQGKMLMNFGPINQNGGEKRLNVIFSRAKKHMVVVSSIDAAQITNTYNTGANALRQYLRYAKAVSEGNACGMQAALLEYGAPAAAPSAQEQALVRAIAERLQQRGLVVTENYGQSELTCDLAVRRADQTSFELAVLTDNRRHYAIVDPIERYHTAASVLNAFGWRVCFVLAKDWYKDAEAVVERILALLNAPATQHADTPDADA